MLHSCTCCQDWYLLVGQMVNTGSDGQHYPRFRKATGPQKATDTATHACCTCQTSIIRQTYACALWVSNGKTDTANCALSCWDQHATSMALTAGGCQKHHHHKARGGHASPQPSLPSPAIASAHAGQQAPGSCRTSMPFHVVVVSRHQLRWSSWTPSRSHQTAGTGAHAHAHLANRRPPPPADKHPYG